MGSSTMSEKLCLKWNDFQDNINTALGILRSEHEFSDVTLACEDGEQVEAHKVILAASSPFFKNLLRRNKHPHPLIYMRGVKSGDLVAIVDFLYYGEANGYQENIGAFLAIAEELKLKGLTGSGDKEKTEPDHIPSRKRVTSLPNVKQTKADYLPKIEKESSYGVKELPSTESIETAVSNFAVSSVNITDIQELDEKVRSMMTKSENRNSAGQRHDSCIACGKEGAQRQIKDHIEANHLDGVSIPCNYCEKTFRSRAAFRQHNTSYHK